MHKYKPIVPWMGGKRRLAKHILPLIPQHTCYCEPFTGGAAILFLKEPSKVEVINDINGGLINLYRVVKYHLNEFIAQFKFILISRQQYEWQKMANTENLTDIQRAANFYYIQRLSFGATLNSRNYGYATICAPKLNLLRIEEELSQAHIRLARVNIEHLDWEGCIKRYDRAHTFFYLDPPYWQMTGYKVDFEWSNYEQIAEFMKTAKGKFLLSINDHPDIKKLFKDFNIKTVGIKYTVGGSKVNTSQSNELLIMNY